MIHLIFLAMLMTSTAHADDPAACEPAATLETARRRIEPLAAAVRLQGGGVLTWASTTDNPDDADSTPFEQWITRYTGQTDPAQAAAWQTLTAELQCQFTTLVVYHWEEPCHNCHEFRVLIFGQASWGSAGLAGSMYWDS